MRLSGAITKIKNGRKVMAVPAGMHSLTDNVWLRVKSDTNASWLFIGVVGGRRRQIGIGGGRFVSKDEAREAAEKIRAEIRAGNDPVAVRIEAKPVPSFAKVLDSYLASGWKGSDGTELQWRQQLGKHCPKLLALPVDRIDTEAVVAELLPIWNRTLGVTQRMRIERCSITLVFRAIARATIRRAGMTISSTGFRPERAKGRPSSPG